MSRTASDLLSDIRSAAVKILDKAGHVSADQYAADEDLQLIVERLFTILGEAAVRLQRHHPDVAAQLPRLRGPIAFRNFLIHVYDAIEHPKVWTIIREDVSPLIDEIKRVEAILSTGDQK